MQKERALIFLKVAINYLQLTENIGKEIAKQGNKNFVMSNDKLSQEEIEENTKWNDYQIVEPFFFNFYHGLELLIKGFLLFQNVDVVKHNHRIEKLYEEFCIYFSDKNNMIGIINKYIGQNINLVEPLKSFFISNMITVDSFYLALKYPESRHTTVKYNYETIKFQGEKVIEFYKQLTQDIASLMKETVSFGRKNLY
jgi:hypothetical protein